MVVFLITFGQYSAITLGPAFTNREAAEAYQREREANPQRTLGPVAPITIVELDVFGRAEDAIKEGH